MLRAPFRVVLDANVLYPLHLRDMLLRAAGAGLYQLYWTQEIIEEARRNLVKNGQMTVEQADRLCGAMTESFPESLVAGYEGLVDAMNNDVKDRHVVAAAVKAGAGVIVTLNMRDFCPLPEGVEAQAPDEFLCGIFDLDPGRVRELVVDQARALRSPPVSMDLLLDRLGRVVPDFVGLLRGAPGD